MSAPRYPRPTDLESGVTPRMRIFRTQEQIDRALAQGHNWCVISHRSPSLSCTEEEQRLLSSKYAIEMCWNYDEAEGRTILVEVDAV